ncbi:hypothetical protein ACFQI7_28115 [Paenibacillus allorhizosphaerae]|uniref:Uncharacterized protein n=1 Tax=Paenibacillus allorhizosphaerae TaxID=2849866 RepID=A0ABM8VNI5_9BACL|nr:hypothetical protein [Paenibacillus allorhizosphaerae]CAG7651531.1 hypothetical protein PAECIP111802_04987 [Paenibacillus allorhizosphaerae]
MGRKPIDPAEKLMTISINLKQKVIQAIERDGIPKIVIQELVNKKYNPDNKN